ncbi:MAG: YlxR family protein [Williamsia herbipolensis]|nr:YlxR family protein [Williamsia herbipolensis]
MRTCVGCRRTDRPTVLLRIVLVRLTDPDSSRETWVAEPDPARRLQGRGAWLHHDARCLEQAERRHAFRRAFRTTEPVDTQRLHRFAVQSDDERAGEKS